jgi:integrase
VGPSRLEAIETNLREAGFSDAVVDKIVSSEATNKLAGSRWAKFAQYCAERLIDPFDPSRVVLSNFAEYLTSELNLKPPTVKGYENAIHVVWDLTSEAICDSETVGLRLQRVNNAASPVKAKYESTYDIRPLLDYVVSLYLSKDPKDVRTRLIILLRTMALRRSSDISYITANSVDLVNRSFRQTRTKNDPNPTGPIMFESNLAEPPLCLKKAFQDYLEIFKSTLDKDPEGPLLRALKGDQPISSATISKIALKAMTAAGIDVAVYKAHSLRMAAASALLDAGMKIEEVMKLGSWKSPQVFLKFYHRARVTGTVNAFNSLHRGSGRTRGSKIR